MNRKWADEVEPGEIITHTYRGGESAEPVPVHVLVNKIRTVGNYVYVIGETRLGEVKFFTFFMADAVDVVVIWDDDSAVSVQE